MTEWRDRILPAAAVLVGFAFLAAACTGSESTDSLPSGSAPGAGSSATTTAVDNVTTTTTLPPPDRWAVGPWSCETPPDGEVADDEYSASFVDVAVAEPGQSFELELTREIVFDAFRDLGADVEVALFGGTPFLLWCWNGDSWSQVWRWYPPFPGETRGNGQVDINRSVSGEEVLLPLRVDLEMPDGGLPPGEYRWRHELVIVVDGDRRNVYLVQPLTVTAG